MKTLITFIFSLFLNTVALAADGDAKLAHESQAGLVLTSGNSDTQTYSAKQETSYHWSENTANLTGSFLIGKASGTTTAKKWDLGVRYDRLIIEALSAFTGYQIDANPFSGTDFRHTFDLGGKYRFLKSDTRALFTEAGYRLTAEKFTLDNGATSNGSLTSHMSRVYVEWSESWNDSVSSKLWAEYLQSFTNTKDYRFNIEPSVSVLLSQAFSLKVAYLINYRNVPAVAGKKTTDTLYTTSLVAKF